MRRIVSTVFVLLLAPAAASAMSMVESRPAGGAVVTGNSTELFVRFDAPVDHRQSALLLLRGGQVVQTLRPRLDSSPDVLFARAVGLTPGDYDIRWVVRSLADGAVEEGLIPFTVKAN